DLHLPTRHTLRGVDLAPATAYPTEVRSHGGPRGFAREALRLKVGGPDCWAMGSRGSTICVITTAVRCERADRDRFDRTTTHPRPSPYEGAALSAAPRSRDVSVRESGDVEMWAGPGAHTSSPMRGEEAGCLPRSRPRTPRGAGV